MDKIVSDLQAFVQPVKIDKKPIILKELVDGVLATPTNILVLTQIEECFPQIKADINLLKRVLINLVTNSVQAMPDGGKLTLLGRLIQKVKFPLLSKILGLGFQTRLKNIFLRHSLLLNHMVKALVYLYANGLLKRMVATLPLKAPLVRALNS